MIKGGGKVQDPVHGHDEGPGGHVEGDGVGMALVVHVDESEEEDPEEYDEGDSDPQPSPVLGFRNVCAFHWLSLAGGTSPSSGLRQKLLYLNFECQGKYGMSHQLISREVCDR